jgi:hypothetical protein
MRKFSYEEYLEALEIEGYIAKDGQPLKCRFCDSTKPFKESDIYHENYFKVEYQLSCSDCNNRLSIWAYGQWQLVMYN